MEAFLPTRLLITHHLDVSLRVVGSRPLRQRKRLCPLRKTSRGNVPSLRYSLIVVRNERQCHSAHVIQEG